VQKFTFNFIKQFSTETNISFNELNFRKCLTFKLKSPITEASPISLLESLGAFSQGVKTACGPPPPSAENNIDAENFYILLQFSLDEGSSQETWCRKLLSCLL
jgi:hypothetical protein